MRPSDEGGSQWSTVFSQPRCVDPLVICKVYCADHTYTTMKMRMDTPASKIIRIAAEKLGLRSDQPDDLKLCEVKSTGGENDQRTGRTLSLVS